MSVSAFFRWDFGWEAALVLTGNADEWRPLTEVIHRECGPQERYMACCYYAIKIPLHSQHQQYQRISGCLLKL